MSYEFDKVYHYDLSSWINIDGWSEKETIALMDDGRFASHILERQIPKWFPTLDHITGCKDHDHVDKTNGLRFDAKNLTKNGCKFMPSSMLGAGRRFNQNIFLEKAKTLNYIICDIADFPSVRLIFKRGGELASDFPKGSISKVKGRRLLFD